MTAALDKVHLAVRHALHLAEDDDDGLADRLIGRVENLLRRNFNLSYFDCDLLLADLRHDLDFEARKFLAQYRRIIASDIESVLDEDGAGI